MFCMAATYWYLLAGLLFLVMGVGSTALKRLPITTSIVYLLVGLALGPTFLDVLRLDVITHSRLLEHLSEAAVLISLFTAGLKLRTPLSNKRWLLPLRLAGPSMVVTVGLVTLVSVFVLDLPVGAGVLLGAVLAPTDPVLASDVQLSDPNDRDRLRFTLTGEAAMNDGAAFPFVMLGLGLLGLHEMGDYALRWVFVDLLWATTGGLLIGWTAGTLVGRFVLYLRKKHKESTGLDDFLCLGLIAVAYGLGLWAHTYGFLAVFAAGLAIRQIEAKSSTNPTTETPDAPPQNHTDSAPAPDPSTAPSKASARMAGGVLEFNEQLERIAEVLLVIVLGLLLASMQVTRTELLFAALMLFVFRPVSVAIGLAGSGASRVERRMCAWFGIRGVGSVFYLMYAMNHGLSEELGRSLAALTVTTAAASIVLHGVSVTPLMTQYRRLRGRSPDATSA